MRFLFFQGGYFTALIAVLGTTISPYLFFWQASQEVEDGALVEVKIRQLKLPRHLYLLSRRGTRLSHATAALVRLLRGVPAQS